jgi:hypothetical protein
VTDFADPEIRRGSGGIPRHPDAAPVEAGVSPEISGSAKGWT